MGDSNGVVGVVGLGVVVVIEEEEVEVDEEAEAEEEKAVDVEPGTASDTSEKIEDVAFRCVSERATDNEEDESRELRKRAIGVLGITGV